jgi:hypothetical protein
MNTSDTAAGSTWRHSVTVARSSLTGLRRIGSFWAVLNFAHQNYFGYYFWSPLHVEAGD